MISHIFEYHQIILTEDWVEKRVPIRLPMLEHIKAFRPSTEDLLLTKMMRGDTEDKKHINFLLREGRFSDEFLLQLYERAQLPDIQEIREIFSSLKDWVRSENDRIQIHRS